MPPLLQRKSKNHFSSQNGAEAPIFVYLENLAVNSPCLSDSIVYLSVMSYDPLNYVQLFRDSLLSTHLILVCHLFTIVWLTLTFLHLTRPQLRPRTELPIIFLPRLLLPLALINYLTYQVNNLSGSYEVEQYALTLLGSIYIATLAILLLTASVWINYRFPKEEMAKANPL